MFLGGRRTRQTYNRQYRGIAERDVSAVLKCRLCKQRKLRFGPFQSYPTRFVEQITIARQSNITYVKYDFVNRGVTL